jgi:glycosyltransferase involved in cell wall biosynthesis
MRYLFIHPVFPGQFGKLMETLAADPQNEVWHLSRQAAVAAVPGVRKLQYRFEGTPPPAGLHPFLLKLHEALQQGDAVTRALLQLRREGYRPDLIYGYTGFGHTLFVKDVYPDVPFVGYFEWFLNSHGAEYNFDPAFPLDFERQRALRLVNANTLLDLHHCDAGVTPTQWQLQQFPAEFRGKLRVIHDGIDTSVFRPEPVDVLPIGELQLYPGETEIVTYTTRGMEPFRGFPQFMRALSRLQQRRPQCHAVIAGTEENFYSRALPDGRSYKQALLEELKDRLDLRRVHFTGWLDGEAYRRVLRSSAAHVYLTYPYVLSWSLLEAMASGCQVIGSRTPPVQEVIRHGDNGLLVDFFDEAALADTLEQALDDLPRSRRLRAAARATVEEQYARHQLVPVHARWVREWVQAGRRQ